MQDATLLAGFLLTALTPLAAAGVAMLNSGLSRSRNAAHCMLGVLAAVGVAALVFFAVGFSFSGAPGGPEHVVLAAGKRWGWLGAERLFLRGLPLEGSALCLYAMFGMSAAGIAAAIPVGTGSDRWRIGAIGWSTVLLSGWTWPLAAHAIWEGGWLAKLGVVDSGGAGAIHVVGGVTALSIAWILGPRRGKYNREGMPTAMPGHNMALVLTGCFAAWLGWIGLNGAGALLFTGVDVGRLPLVELNTTLSAAAALVAAGAITRARFGRVDASLCANGWVAGLVSVSAGCATMRPAGAVLAGAIGGTLAIYTIEWLELHLSVDDPGGAISVHGVAGIWSLLAVGILAADAQAGQLLAQAVAVGTLLGAILPLAYLGNLALNRISPQRVHRDGERQGLDLYELGAGAYPDFVSHTDDSWLR